MRMFRQDVISRPAFGEARQDQLDGNAGALDDGLAHHGRPQARL
jgi:hypothetical protein